MQLMPTTAIRVANQLGIQRSDYQESSLYNPQQNIRLGTHYFGQLLKEFQGHIIYSVAAYNAGPHVVKRWITQSVVTSLLMNLWNILGTQKPEDM